MTNFSIPTKQILFKNGALLILPPMVITFGLWSLLPETYGPEIFWSDIPEWLGLFENIFRILVFSIPGILYFGKGEKGQSLGWYLYVGGLVVYLASYLMQIEFPESAWSQGIIGFTAPAWTTALWFAGIGLICMRSWLSIPWHRAVYFITVALFLVFHIWHTGLVFFNVFG